MAICFKSKRAHEQRVKSMRDTLKKLTVLFRDMREQGLNVVRANENHGSSHQVLAEIAARKLGVDTIDDLNNYLIMSKPTFGYSTISDVSYLLWKGDRALFITALQGIGIEVLNPNEPKQTITIRVAPQKQAA
jgi:hypothetical protein